MGIFGWFADLFSSDVNSPSIAKESYLDDFAVNPANGLPMVGGTGGVGIEGNPYGFDFSRDQMVSSSFDDS